MSTVYNDPIMLDSTGQDIVTKLDSIASLMGDGVIDDTSTATDTTWSSNKITSELAGKQPKTNFNGDEFVKTIDKILKFINIEQVEYISSVLSEAIYLLEPEIRDTGAILIDCGYISSFITTVKGDGLTTLNAFSVGGGHVTADLCEVLQIGFNQAENLKRKVVLSLDATDSDYYEINVNNQYAQIYNL
jgi:hypothetical protein